MLAHEVVARTIATVRAHRNSERMLYLRIVEQLADRGLGLVDSHAAAVKQSVMMDESPPGRQMLSLIPAR
jgi:hypothetical protein